MPTPRRRHGHRGLLMTARCNSCGEYTEARADRWRCDECRGGIYVQSMGCSICWGSPQLVAGTQQTNEMRRGVDVDPISQQYRRDGDERPEPFKEEADQ